MPDATARLRAAALAMLVTFLWSTSWVLIKHGLDDLPPITFAGIRYGLAALILVTWTSTGTRRGVLRSLDRASVWPLVGLGAVMYALTQGAQFVAIDSQPFATTNLMLAMTPLVVALSSALLLSEHTTTLQRVGGVVIVAGVAAYFAGDLGATRVGMAAATIGLIANAGAAMLGRSINRSTALSPTVVTTVSMSVGAVMLFATGLALDGLPRIPLGAAAILLWLAVVNTAAAFTWWNHAQRSLTATEAAAINTTMAVQIPILGWIFFDERLGAAEIIGITLMVIGVLTMRARNTPGRASRAVAARGPKGGGEVEGLAVVDE